MEGWKNWNLRSWVKGNNKKLFKNKIKLLKLIRIQKQKQKGYDGEVVVLSLCIKRK